MTFGAHFIETQQAQAFCDLARELVVDLPPSATTREGYQLLSWGNPETRERYTTEAMPFRACGDKPADVADMAGSLSSCGQAAMGRLQRLRARGEVVNLRGRRLCNPLAEPFAGHYDAPVYLETLGQQRGLLRRPVVGEVPQIEAGSIIEVGGNDGLPPAQQIYGGGTHIIMVVGVGDDGILETIEGGQLDPRNPKPSPKNCTAIAARRRELHARQPGGWWLRTAGSREAGRMLRWWFWTGALPLEEGA